MLYCVMQWSILAFIYFVFLSFALFHANIGSTVFSVN